MYKNFYTDENAFDHITQTWHCINCGIEVESHGNILTPHVLMNFMHYGWIKYPAIFNPDGTAARPERAVLALLPKQTTVKYCMKCLPVFQDQECAGCGKPINANDEYSFCDSIEIHNNTFNGNFRKLIFHHDCLPVHFSEVRKYKERYG